MKEDKISKEWYYTALKSIGDAVMATDAKGRITFMNKVAEDLTKWKQKDSLGKQLSTVFKIVSEVTGKKAVSPLNRVLKEGKIVGLANHTALINKKGKQIAIEDSGAPIRDEKGKITGAVLVFHDVTEKRKAETELKESEIKFRDISLSTADWIWEVDAKGRYTYVSKKVKDILGYSPKEIIGKTPFDLMLPEEAKRVGQIFGKIIQKKENIIDLENWNLTKKGEKICLLTNGVPLLDEKGNLRGYRGVDKDITKSKEVKRQLVEEKKITEEYLDIAGAMIIVLDNQGNIVLMNKMAHKVLGYKEGELDGKNWFDCCLPKEIVPEIKKVHKKIVKGELKPVKKYENPVVTKKGEVRLVEWTNTFLKDDEGKIISSLSSGLDITEQRKAENELKESEEKNRTWLEHSPVCTKIVNLDLTLQYMSHAGAKGLKIDDISKYYGKPYPFSFYPKSFKDLMVNNLIKAKTTGEVVEQEAPVVDKKGNEVWYHSTIIPVKDDKGKIEYLMVISVDTTKRNYVKRELVESEEKLKDKLELIEGITKDAKDAIFAKDLESKYTFVNPAAAKMIGRKAGEIIGKTPEQVFSKADAQTVREVDKLCFKGQAVDQVRKLSIGGKDFYLRTKQGPLYGEGKKIQGVVGIVTDETKERQIKEALSKSEKKYRTLVEAANDVIIFIDKQGRVLEVNKKLIDISGYKKEEIVGKRISVLRNILPRDSMVTILKNFARRIGGAEIGTYVVKIKTKKGELRDFEISAQVIQERGEAVGNLAILRDVTDRMKAEDEIIKSQEEMEAIVENIGDGVFVLDNERKITMFNKEAERISGWKRGEVIGKEFDKFLKFVIEGTDKDCCGFIHACFESGKPKKFTNHAELILKDGERIATGQSVSPLRNQERKITGCVVVFRDISKEREIDKMKTEFVSVASHQLRTPLSGVKWISELLLRGKAGKLSPKQEEYVRDIYSSNDRLIGLVGDLLDVSHIETGRKFNIVKRKTSTCNIIDEVVKEKKERFKQKQIKFVRKCGEGEKCLMISVDGAKIKQVFANLLDNAIKFAPEKGRIELGCKANQKEIVFQIKDNGVGIPKRQQQRVFEKFFRADNVSTLDVGGTGLGLYIAKAIVEAHDGDIWFESKENKGTTFYVSIPLNIKIKKK